MHVYYQRMRDLAYKFSSSPDAIDIALRFTLRTGVHTAIVGTTSPKHMRSNIQVIRNLDGSDPHYEEIRDRWRQIAAPDWIGQM
jgi:aryl-alcohol dehydrogenase-like predicted oxidoreductase